MNCGVGCLGSPIPRLIGLTAAFGATLANNARKRSNGYGCNSASCGFNGAGLEGIERGERRAIIRDRRGGPDGASVALARGRNRGAARGTGAACAGARALGLDVVRPDAGID